MVALKHHATIDVFRVRFRRRRYGLTWFCWVTVFIKGKWQELGDPFEKFRPTNAEIKEAIVTRFNHDGNQ